MTDEIKIRIAKSFYSKSRKQFLPLTADDILTRTGIIPNVAKSVRISMFCDGLLEITGRAHGAAVPAIYELTPTGRKLAGVAE